MLVKASNCLILANFEAFSCLFHFDLLLNLKKTRALLLYIYIRLTQLNMNGMDSMKTPVFMYCVA